MAVDLAANSRYILTAVENAAVSQGYVLPGRRYITVGGSVFDCPQCTVSAMSTATGIVSPDNQSFNVIGPCPPVWNATFEVGIVVRAHEATIGARGEIPPDPEAIESDANEISRATGVLLEAIDLITAENVLGRIQATVAYGQPQGGLIAVVATLIVNMWL